MKLRGIKLSGTYKIIYYDASFEVYNEKDKAIYSEDNDGFWEKRKYNEKGNEICYESRDGYWSKKEYDEKGNVNYYENSNGIIIDERVKELTIEQIEKLLGYKIKIKGK